MASFVCLKMALPEVGERWAASRPTCANVCLLVSISWVRCHVR